MERYGKLLSPKRIFSTVSKKKHISKVVQYQNGLTFEWIKHKVAEKLEVMYQDVNLEYNGELDFYFRQKISNL